MVERLRLELERHATEAFSLARWKITAVTVLIVTGLGWNVELPGKPSGLAGLLILYSTGFLCAYIDSLFYRRGSATHAIAAFLRKGSGPGDSAAVEARWEQWSENLRKKGKYFLPDFILQFMASLVFSVGPAVLGFIAYDPVAKNHAPLLIIPFLALALNVIMFAAYHRKRQFLRSKEDV